MNFLCAVSVTLRLACLAFLVGVIVGLVLGYRAVGGPAEPDRIQTTAVPVLVSEFPCPPPLS
jgi:hypothetical protein